MVFQRVPEQVSQQANRKDERPPGKRSAGRTGGRARTTSLDMGILPRLIGYNLRFAQVAVFQHFDAAFRAHDISAPQFGALLLIEANPGLSQSSVAEALRFDRSTLVQIIDRLEGRGLVVRQVSSHDRRSHALALTEQGTALLADLKALALRHERDVSRALSEEEKETLIHLLERIHSG